MTLLRPPINTSVGSASINTSIATAYGVAYEGGAQADVSHVKLMSCYFAMLGVTLFWLVTLTKYSQKPGCLPWCLTFTVISLVLASKLFSGQIHRTHGLTGGSVQKESRILVETLTSIYALTSLAICLAFLNTHWFVIDRTVLTQQMIEIELSPLASAPMPDQQAHAARPASRPASRSAALTKAQPVLSRMPKIAAVVGTATTRITPPKAISPAPASTASASLQPAKQLTVASAHPHSTKQATVASARTQPTKQTSDRTILTTSPFAPSASTKLANRTAGPPAVASSSKQLPMVTPLRSLLPVGKLSQGRHVSRAQSGSSFFMEEVPPAQLVEVRETDNSTPATFRSAANSTEAADNASLLAEYLRELHRIIKAAWSPPRDTTRSTEILFRIKRSGELALVKVLRSSGDTDSDESAINAVTTAAPFKPLPAGYSLAGLDVDYTFNFTADRLTEVGSGYR